MTKEAEQLIEAIRSGAVDAFVVEEHEGNAVYALQSADLPYSTLVHEMQQGAAMLNSRGDVIYCNPSLAALLGMGCDVIVGLRLVDLVEPEDRPAFQKLLQEFRQGSREAELRLHHADQTPVPARVSIASLSRDGSIIGVLVVDLAVEKSNAQLTSRLLGLQDEERRNIGRELHDSVGQLLAAVSMNLERLRREGSGLNSDLLRLVDNNSALVDQVTKEIRTISHLLHPPLLDVAGLCSAVRWYVDGFSERSEIKVVLDAPDDFGRLAQDVEIAAFRVVQECLTNVYRHSGSESCSIRMNVEQGRLRIEVKDQGCGMPTSGKPSQSSGLGLRGMQERIRRLGGTLQIESAIGGTTVRVDLPASRKSLTEESSPVSAA
jgi:PAS domain S-box-containing protein